MITIALDTVAAVASIITLLVLIAGGIFWLGQLTNRVGQLENRVDELDNKIDQLSDGLRRRCVSYAKKCGPNVWNCLKKCGVATSSC